MSNKDQYTNMDRKTRIDGEPEEFICIIIGRGGVTWYKRGRETEYGYTKGKIQSYYRQEAREYEDKFGVTLIDSTTVPDENLSDVAVSGPLLAQMPRDVDWDRIENDNIGSLTRVTPKMFMEHYKEYGATIENENQIPEFEKPEQ